MKIQKNLLIYLAGTKTWTILFVLIINAYSCGYTYNPEYDYDNLTFFEPTVVDKGFLKGCIMFSSTHMGFSDQEISVPKRGKGNPESSVDSTTILEWKIYFAESLKIEISEEKVKNIIFSSQDMGIIVNRDTQNYLEFMKDAAKLIGGNWDGWSRQDIRLTKEERNSLMLTYCNKAVQNSKDIKINCFLRARYMFQAVRLFALQGEYEKAIQTFDELSKDNKTRTLIYYRALGYKAQSQLRLKKRKEALFSYLEILQESPEMSNTIMLSLQCFSEEPWKELFSANLKKEMRIHALKTKFSTNCSSYQDIKALLDLIPESSDPESAMLLFVERTERANLRESVDELVTNSIFHRIFGVFRKGKNSNLIEICEKAVNNNGVKNKAFWSCCESYLYLLDGDTGQAEKQIIKAKTCKTKNKQLQKQIHLIETLIQIKKNNGVISAEIEKRVIDDLAWAKSLNEWIVNNQGIYHSILNVCALRYLVLGEFPKAMISFEKIGSVYGLNCNDAYWTGSWFSQGGYLCNFMLDAIADDKDLAKFEQMFDEKQGPLITYLLKESIMKKSDVAYLQGIKEIRKNNFQKAVEIFKRLPKEYFQPGQEVRLFYGETIDRNLKCSKVFLYKTVVISKELPDTKAKEKWQIQNVLEFSEMMDKYWKELATATTNEERAKINFTLGNIYESLYMTGFRVIFGLGDRVYGRPELQYWANGKFYNHYESRYKSDPLDKIPEKHAEYKQRFEDFSKSIDFREKAIKRYAEVLRCSNDKELIAKALIGLRTQKSLKIINKEYNDTSFYREYIKQCPGIALYK